MSALFLKTKTAQNEPIDGTLGGTILGPTNPSRQAENPDILVPPRTDSGTLPNYKWSFADSHMRLEEGGMGPPNDHPRTTCRQNNCRG